MIPTLPSIARLHVVPVPHTNDATYAVDGSGRRWIAKREADMGSLALTSEALTWLLANAIGAPVPDAAFCDDPSERSWLSSFIPDASHWLPSLADKIANPVDISAILALDVLVYNEARHARNLLAQANADGTVHLWAIDADEALIGYPDDYIERLSELPSIHNHARGLPIGVLATGARAAANRAASLSGDSLTAMVTAACALAREPRVEEIARALHIRAGALPALVERYIDVLRERT